MPRGKTVRRPCAPLAVAVAALILTIAGCVSAPPRPVPAPAPPPDVSAIPNAVPQAEPRSARGNPPFYEVGGKRYFVLASAAGYRERGVASWYGPGFHQGSTSSGEPYDMYAMTAAHKTLPLPSYVRVTNLSNGRSVVVRVNDRGPFKDGRIIDLSYTAAVKLDMLRAGTAFVEVEALTTSAPTATAASNAAPASLYVQAGAFGAQANAVRLLEQLRAHGLGDSFVQQVETGDKPLYRVRIGPIPDVREFDRLLERLKALGVPDARLAAD
ncbi:MAG: septal ring lytic transglycosylase RlpA family protein [Steroidobacteraceae bacterium]|jgi:rare lipoprotein A|nr:septal ring lytic transglycosylase RlpA family protein [Steroidobacteraceae bacterium]